MVFDDDFDDDELEQLEEDEDDESSDSELNALYDAYDEKVEKALNFLESTKSRKKRPEQCVKIIAWLGETGTTEAIPVLVTIYEAEKAGSAIHSAALYALGQFKALDKAIKRDGHDNPLDALEENEDNESLRARLEDAQLRGKYGKSKLIPLPVMLGIMGALTVTLLVLVLANLASSGGKEEFIAPTRVGGENAVDPGHGAALEAISILRDIVEEDRGDATQLKELFGAAIISNTIDCTKTFSTKGMYTPEDLALFTYPNLTNYLSRLEGTTVTLNLMVSRYNDLCNNVLAPHLGALREIAKQVTTANGALTTLAANWDEVNANGNSDNCAATPPAIPEDYTAIPEELLARHPELKRAQEQVNLTLLLLRESWGKFVTGCETNRLQDELAAGQAQVAGARDALSSVEAALAVTADQVSYADAAASIQTLEHLVTELSTLKDELYLVEGQIINAEISPSGGLILPTLVPTDMPKPTDTPIPTDTPTPDPSVINSHITTLQWNIGLMMDERTGTAILLAQYWQDVSLSGTTGGCNFVAEIPDDYTVSPEALNAVPALQGIQENVNQAIVDLRQSWAIFYAACDEGTLVDAMATGESLVQAATEKLNAAQAAIDELQN